MTVRELPFEEWSRLEGTELTHLWKTVTPDVATMIVVEDERGAIVGTWSILAAVHAEGFGIAPACRCGLVARMLLRRGAEVMQRMGVTGFLTGAATAEMSAYIERVGGTALPATFYAVPLSGRMSRVTRTKEN